MKLKIKKAAAIAAALMLSVILMSCQHQEKPDFHAAVNAVQEPFDAKYVNDDGEPLGKWDSVIADKLDVSEDGTTLCFTFGNVDYNSFYEHYKDDKSAWETTLRLILLQGDYEAELKFIEMLEAELGAEETVLPRIRNAAPTYESSLNTAMSSAGYGDDTQKTDDKHIEFTEDRGGYTVTFSQETSGILTEAVLTYTAT